MATSDALKREEELLLTTSFIDLPKGDDVPMSAFSMTNVGEWDPFRNIDMDKEAGMITSLKGSSKPKKSRVDAEKMAALSAWHRVDCQTREALQHSFLLELIEGYEECIRSFIKETDGDVLVLHVQDPFQRLLLHGVCEFYDLVSATTTRPKDGKSLKMTTIERKKSGSTELPNITVPFPEDAERRIIW